MDDFDNSPWELLGLDPGTATDREIKRAYARLIKIHRPDIDPDGFQRAREAYEWALRFLEFRDQAGDADDLSRPAARLSGRPVPSMEDQPDASPAAVSPEYDRAGERLRNALTSSDPASAVPAPLDDFIAAGLGNDAARLQLDAALWAFFYEQIPLLASLIALDQLSEMALANAREIPLAVASHWRSSNQYERLIQFGEILRSSAPRLHSSEAAFTFAQIADLLAFVDSFLAKSLANAAFKHLPPALREGIMHQVDYRLATGKLFDGLPRDQIHFWEQCLFHGHERAIDWSEPAAAAALWKLTRSRPPRWPGFGLLGDLVPPGLLRKYQMAYLQPGRQPPQFRQLPAWVGKTIVTLVLLALGAGIWKLVAAYTNPNRNRIRYVVPGQPARYLTNEELLKAVLEKTEEQARAREASRRAGSSPRSTTEPKAGVQSAKP